MTSRLTGLGKVTISAGMTPPPGIATTFAGRLRLAGEVLSGAVASIMDAL